MTVSQSPVKSMLVTDTLMASPLANAVAPLSPILVPEKFLFCFFFFFFGLESVFYTLTSQRNVHQRIVNFKHAA
jgi:hypothetical protein